MSVLLYGILGPFSGKVGNVVGVVGKDGSFYVRGVPLHYRDRKSVAQLRFRGRAKLMMTLLSAAKDFTNSNLDRMAERMSATNLAMKMNFGNAVFANEDASAFWIDYEKVRLSAGKTAGVDGLRAEIGDGKLILHWMDNGGLAGASGTDRLQVFVYDENRTAGLHAADVGTRSGCMACVELPEDWIGERLHVYAAMKSEDGESSETGYAFVCEDCRGIEGSERAGAGLEQSTTCSLFAPLLAGYWDGGEKRRVIYNRRRKREFVMRE